MYGPYSTLAARIYSHNPPFFEMHAPFNINSPDPHQSTKPHAGARSPPAASVQAQQLPESHHPLASLRNMPLPNDLLNETPLPPVEANNLKPRREFDPCQMGFW